MNWLGHSDHNVIFQLSLKKNCLVCYCQCVPMSYVPLFFRANVWSPNSKMKMHLFFVHWQFRFEFGRRFPATTFYCSGAFFPRSFSRFFACPFVQQQRLLPREGSAASGRRLPRTCLRFWCADRGWWRARASEPLATAHFEFRQNGAQRWRTVCRFGFGVVEKKVIGKQSVFVELFESFHFFLFYEL